MSSSENQDREPDLNWEGEILNWKLDDAIEYKNRDWK